MCKTCVLPAHIFYITSCITLLLSAIKDYKKINVGKSAHFPQFYTQIVPTIMNSKVTIIQSVNNCLSTVSTGPIIRSATLNFNEIIII